LLAADAGLLAGRLVTTHHELLDDLQALAPTARVQANRVFVEDGAVLTSAGVTAGIDLALHGVAQVCGEVIAAAVAQVMVVFARRGVQAPQVSALLAHRDHLHPAIHRVQDAVCAAPAEPWDSARMAAVAQCDRAASGAAVPAARRGVSRAAMSSRCVRRWRGRRWRRGAPSGRRWRWPAFVDRAADATALGKRPDRH